MGFLIPIIAGIAGAIGGAATAIGGAVAAGAGAIGGAIGAGAGAIGGAIGAGVTAVEGAFGFGAAAGAAGAAAAGDLIIPAATPIFSGILDGGAAGAGLFGSAAGAVGGATAVEGLTVVGGTAGGSLLGSFADAVIPAAIASPIVLDGGAPSVTYSPDNKNGLVSTLGGSADIRKDITTAADVGSLALLAKSLMAAPPQLSAAPSSAIGTTPLTSPNSNFPAQTFAPQVNPGGRKNLSAMAAAALGGTFTGAGQASGQRKTLLGQ